MGWPLNHSTSLSRNALDLSHYMYIVLLSLFLWDMWRSQIRVGISFSWGIDFVKLTIHENSPRRDKIVPSSSRFLKTWPDPCFSLRAGDIKWPIYRAEKKDSKEGRHLFTFAYIVKRLMFGVILLLFSKKQQIFTSDKKGKKSFSLECLRSVYSPTTVTHWADVSFIVLKGNFSK